MTAEVDYKRFSFGRNWRAFLTVLNDERIAEAEQNLKEMLGLETLGGLTFLDIGSGSGLFSLAARRLGAKVFSFDYDYDSVCCTISLKEKFYPGDKTDNWRIEQSSVLDKDYLRSLGQFDIMYSWGVLHHTGDMWRAIETAAKLVKPTGKFALAIYAKTKMDAAWKIEKRIYSGGSKATQWAIRQAYLASIFFSYVLRGRNPISLFSQARGRGMNFSHDIHDWLGGYPYETASPEELNSRICAMGFSEEITYLVSVSVGLFGSGCHEYVFRRS